MKKIFKEHSPYILIVTLLELVLSIICIEAFVYSDTLSYQDSLIYQAIGIEKLLESIYSSTWWSLILFTLAFITICSITSIIFKKLEYYFMGILSWGIMFLLAINLSKSFLDNLIICLLFIPIIFINIIAYKDELKKINNKEIKKNKTKKVS